MHLHHMAVTVRDLEAMKQFYMTYFGGTPGPLYHNPTSGLMTYFLSFDGEARLELMTRPGLVTGDADAPPTGYAHLAFSAGSRAEVDLLTARLRGDGCSVVSGPRTTGDGYYESGVLDPEGNLIEITV